MPIILDRYDEIRLIGGRRIYFWACTGPCQRMKRFDDFGLRTMNGPELDALRLQYGPDVDVWEQANIRRQAQCNECRGLSKTPDDPRQGRLTWEDDLDPCAGDAVDDPAWYLSDDRFGRLT